MTILPSPVRRLVVALLLSAGIHLIWILCLGYTYDRLRYVDVIRAETLVVDRESETPIIQKPTGHRTLNGEPVNDHRRRPEFARVDLERPPAGEHSAAAENRAWRDNADGIWHVVRRDETSRIYSEGFSRITGLPIGFIGANGFTVRCPTTSEQFSLGQPGQSLNANISSGFLSIGRGRMDYIFVCHHVYLLTEDSVVHVNLNARTTDRLPVGGKPIAMSWIREFDDARVAVRTESSLQLFDETGERVGAFGVPEEVRSYRSLEQHMRDGTTAFLSASQNSREFDRHVQVWRRLCVSEPQI